MTYDKQELSYFTIKFKSFPLIHLKFNAYIL